MRAAHEQGRPGKGLHVLVHGKIQQIRQAVLDGREIDAPDEAAGGGGEILQQELAHGSVRYGCFEHGLGIRTPADAAEVQGGHGAQPGQVIVVGPGRRNVHHHQALHPLWRIQCEAHGCLAAHAVADDGGGIDIMAVQKCAHVVRHGWIAHAFHVGGFTVVAQVQGEDPVLLGEAARDAAPVAAGTQQAVENHDGRAGRLAMRLVAQRDAHGQAACYLRRGT